MEGRLLSLSICRLVIGVNAKNLSSDVCPKQGTKADPALIITPKTSTGSSAGIMDGERPRIQSPETNEGGRDSAGHRRALDRRARRRNPPRLGGYIKKERTCVRAFFIILGD